MKNSIYVIWITGKPETAVPYNTFSQMEAFDDNINRHTAVSYVCLTLPIDPELSPVDVAKEWDKP